MLRWICARSDEQRSNRRYAKPYLSARGGGRRTLETAVIGLGPWARDRGAKLVLCPDLQETGEVACDTGSPLAAVRERWAGDADLLDFSNARPTARNPLRPPRSSTARFPGVVRQLGGAVQVEEGWEVKKGLNKDTGAALLGRLERFLAWLRPREERTVVVVAHHNVFLALLRVSFRAPPRPAPSTALPALRRAALTPASKRAVNCEVRKYEFDCAAPAAQPTGLPGQAGWAAVQPAISASDEARGLSLFPAPC